MLAAHSPSKMTPRRVLGDLAPKALNTPSKRPVALDASEAIRAQSQLKQVTPLSPQPSVNKENLSSAGAYPQGRKRSIYEVDEVETVDNAKAMFGARDAPMFKARGGLTAEAVQRHLVSSFQTRRVSHVPNTVQESNAVDLPIPGSPTECNTPSPEPEAPFNLENSQDTQGSQVSLSNYVDFSLCASQTETVEQPPQPVQEEEKKSRAELLRTRLRFGYYKVETNQASKRGSEVISRWESSFTSTDVSTSMPLTSSSESASSQAIPRITLSPVRLDAQPVFVKANLDPFRPVGKLTPAPILLPTAVSSRMAYDYQMPSSPPQAASPDQLMSPAKQESSHGTPMSKRERSEKEQGEAVHDSLQARLEEGDLTS
jgi:hypothetical protein